MKKSCRFLIFLLFVPLFAVAQNNQKAFYVGHSLSDQIAEMVKSLVQNHPTIQFDFAYQSIPGASLEWNWNNGATYGQNPPHFFGYNDATGGLPNGSFSALVLTESVPRTMSNIINSYNFSEMFYNYALGYNSNTRVYVYEVWHCINSGTPTACPFDVDSNPWRQRLTDDLPMWESIVNHLNTTLSPSTPVCLIPGGQGLATLYDEIQLGTVPGITSMNDLFEDDIHLTDIGKYFIACIHFASLYNTSPVGLPNQLYGMWGGAFTAPNPALALRLQEIAWNTITQYPNSCYSLASVVNYEQLEMKMYPNPTKDYLDISSKFKIDKVEVFDLQGKKIETFLFNANEVTLITSKYNTGVYILKVYSENKLSVDKFVKQ